MKPTIFLSMPNASSFSVRRGKAASLLAVEKASIAGSRIARSKRADSLAEEDIADGEQDEPQSAASPR